MIDDSKTSRHIVEWTDQDGTRHNAAVELSPDRVRMGQEVGYKVCLAGVDMPRERFMALLRMVAREAGLVTA